MQQRAVVGGDDAGLEAAAEELDAERADLRVGERGRVAQPPPHLVARCRDREAVHVRVRPPAGGAGLAGSGEVDVHAPLYPASPRKVRELSRRASR